MRILAMPRDNCGYDFLLLKDKVELDTYMADIARVVTYG